MSHFLKEVRSKILDVSELQDKVREWRTQDESIVFTNGCFDILHLGHLTYLMQSAELGSKLIIGLNSDASVQRQNKGPERPIQDQNSRAIALASLSFVAVVVVFDGDTPLELIKLIRPDILVKGADYDPAETDPQKKTYIVGSQEVKAEGGEVKAVPLLEGYSTSAIVKKLKG